MPSPPATCHAMWQCILETTGQLQHLLTQNGASGGTYSHAPGLSVLNARSSQPAAGSIVTSRLTGLLPFNKPASNAYLVCVAGDASGERPTTRKSCPCIRHVSKYEAKINFGSNLREDESDAGD